MTDVYSDGICDPNPGTACWAFVVHDGTRVTVTQQGALAGLQTNNTAEYAGFGKALAWILTQPPGEFTLYTDSQLVLNQVAGQWACNVERLEVLRDRCKELIEQIKEAGSKIELQWISGAKNPADGPTRDAYFVKTGKVAKDWRAMKQVR